MRIGVVGVGRIGAFHAHTLRGLTRVDEVVVADLDAFCEEPVAATLSETLELAAFVADSTVPVQIGFQRRFDAGYQQAARAIREGELGFVHTIRANTHDQAPPRASYLPTSGALFRDCSIHDIDVIRYVTRQEVISVFATVDVPRGPRHTSLMERFLPAYRAELTAFTAVAGGEIPSPCTVDDALQAFRVAEPCEMSRHEGRPVSLEEVKAA